MNFLAETAIALVTKLPVTIALAVTSGLFGAAVALPLAMMLGHERRWLRWPAAAYVGVVRGTPALVQLYLVYYGLPQFDAVRDGPLWPLLRNPAICAILTLTLHHAAYLAAILAGAVSAVPRGEVEAARAFGMSRITLIRRVIAPHAIRLAWPAWGNEAISLLKTTALCCTITMVELTGAAAIVASESFRPFAAFILAGILYLMLTMTLSGLWHFAERRLFPSIKVI